MVEHVQLRIDVVPSKEETQTHLNPFSESLSSVLNHPKEVVLVTGTVLVRNHAYEKRVSVRYTTDFWSSFHDVACHYLGKVEPQGIALNAQEPQ
jgi:hypothetical protein